MEPISKKTVNGKTFEYADVIHHHTDSTFGFWDRKKPIKMDLETAGNTTNNTAHILGAVIN